VKRVLLTAFVRSGMHRLVQGMSRRRLTIFMLHRFDDPATGVHGLSPDALRSTLAVLRREEYRFVDLHEGLCQLRDDPAALERAVAFTVDDGYADQVRVGAPLFAEFDCPATVFATTGFLDGDLWFWWDRIEHVIRETRRRDLEISVGEFGAKFKLDTLGAREAAQVATVSACKRVADGAKHEAIARLAELADVPLPPAAPPQYAPVTWDELRKAEVRGMRFGPHTVTHPILARTDDQQCEAEVRGSWERLRQEARNPTPVFCYPNGQPADFGPRETDLLAGLGLLAAVTGQPGYAGVEHLGPDAGERRFHVPRFDMAGDPVLALQYACGLEALKERVRRRAW
jgi:peptidoglycan/xylan/chitin deacetylase (PgdA/CDA1 family)